MQVAPEPSTVEMLRHLIIWVFPKIRISNKVIGESVRNEQMIFLQREIVICFANGSSKFSIITSPRQWPMRPKRPHGKYDFSFRQILFFRSSLFCLLDFLASLGTIWLGGWRECLYCFLYVHHHHCPRLPRHNKKIQQTSLLQIKSLLKSILKKLEE